MKKYDMNNDDLRQWCYWKETSDEVGQAIFELAKDEEEMDRIWDDPTPEEIAIVSRRALEISGGEKDLHWGWATVRCDEWKVKL